MHFLRCSQKKSEEEQFTGESKTQEEIVHSLKRELISQIMPYGYKTLPDKNPGEVVEALAKRWAAWQEGAKKADMLEREMSSAQAKMSNLRKEQEGLRQRREECVSRLKAVEADRDTVKQQRVILFESRNPAEETARMTRTVDDLRRQLNERRESRNEKAAALDRILTAVHTLETEMATGREDLQKHEITFSKKLLALGFRNEEDYSAALLTPDERRDLQEKLRELRQTDFDLQTQRENTRAEILRLQADGAKLDTQELNAKAKALKADIDSLRGDGRPSAEIVSALRELMLTCGLEEVF